MFPRFRIHSVESGKVLGAVTATMHGTETWVSDKYLGYLMLDEKLVSGRWHKHEDCWSFAPDDDGAIESIHPNGEWLVLDGYWGERVELVRDSERLWQKAKYNQPDHEHCAICWQTIEAGGEGYASQEDTWVCMDCYLAFIQARSLEFIPKPKD